MNTEKKREEKAANRIQLILPLLDERLDPAQLQQLKEEISGEHDVSIRTLERYMDAYRKNGFAGLKPGIPKKVVNKRLHPHYDKIVEQAEILRKEVPARSVSQIIRILEMEGYAKPGELKRSTLQEHLLNNGYGAKQMRTYSKKGLASRRFQKPHRCMLYQGDIKYGPFLPIGSNHSKKQVYLAAFIDDATRYIVSAKFYKIQRAEIIEDSLRIAVMNFGKPDAIYVDNGKQYRSKCLQTACNKLGIRLLFTKPFSPEAKGKIEAFNRTLDSFLTEISIEKPQSLDDLNHKLDCWISEYYHKKPHSSLGEKSPELVFKSDTKPLRFVSSDILAEAFLHSDERLVDKTGCISLAGNQYEAGMDLIGRRIEVVYDPLYLEEVEIHSKDKKPYRVRQLEIGAYCGVKKELPKPSIRVKVSKSRMLAGLEKAHAQNGEAQPAVLNFRDMEKGTEND